MLEIFALFLVLSNLMMMCLVWLTFDLLCLGLYELFCTYSFIIVIKFGAVISSSIFVLLLLPSPLDYPLHILLVSLLTATLFFF